MTRTPHDSQLEHWKHDHSFGQEHKRPGESRTLMVIGLTATMMVVEIVAGIRFGSMALLADGLHMASHAAALGISAFAYIYARRHAHNPLFSFGTGKVNALGGYSGAVLLAVFALMMVWESVHRLIQPVGIVFDQAIMVAVVGLVVNGVSFFILRVDDHHEAGGNNHAHHGDHNLKSATLHVLADALTSLTAIAALLAAKYLGLIWMDATMGIVGAALVTNWSLSLLRTTSGILLDKQGPADIRQGITASIEQDGDSKVADLHLWSIGPNIYSVIIVVVSSRPQTPQDYKARVPANLGLEHILVEVHDSTRA